MILSYIVSIFFILIGVTSVVTKKCLAINKTEQYTEESKRKMSFFGGITIIFVGICLLGGNIVSENMTLWRLFHNGLYFFVILYIALHYLLLKKKAKF